jgi:phospholipase A1
MKRILSFFLFLTACYCAPAQTPATHRDSVRMAIREQINAIRPEINADSVRAVVEHAPFFSLYKDNYLIGGIPVGDKMTAANSNVKFQLSIRQKLTRSKLPFDTYLYIQFTQKTIWNVLEESLPIHDMNFNPGIGFGHLIIQKNQYIGNAYLMIEHESNGKDGELSRSWNKVSFGGNMQISKTMDMQFKTWIPIIDGENNRDILRYNGLALGALNYRAPNQRFNATVVATWRSKSFSFNTQWEVSYKVNNNENQYMFLQYYNCYGENLLDYNKYRSIVRIGFVIKPQGLSIF